MNNSRFSGDSHVREVNTALHKMSSDGKWPTGISILTQKTAEYIWNKYPLPDRIFCKLNQDNPDKYNDLILYKDQNKYPINLFIVQGNSIIQPKNLGAKSFLSKYFLSEEIQVQFNSYLETEYDIYLKALIELKGVTYLPNSTRELKAILKELYPHFDDGSNIFRERFLFSIRDYCFTLLQQTYNTNSLGFQNAFKSLLLADETNIVTRSFSDRVVVEEFRPELTDYHNIIVYKKGKTIIGIQCGTVALTLRFKFENKPDSSIKLATSFETYSKIADFTTQTIHKNNLMVNRINKIFEQTEFNPDKNVSNAIGKCHEAFSYYWVVKNHPTVIQADDNECADYLESYLSKIDSATASAIKESSEKTAAVFAEYIHEKKGAVSLVGIQLVADIYTTDRLNTGDLKVSMRLTDGSVEEIFISLKAIRRFGQKITTKNPGIGTILGATYFDLEIDLSIKVQETKAEYTLGLSHKDSLIKISNELGTALEQAPQHNLRRGLENLLGKALMVVTAYGQKKVRLIEHHQIISDVTVRRNVPSDIQNTLTWNEGEEKISLRVKFSSGHHHGWSSVKLTSEYSFDPNNKC